MKFKKHKAGLRGGSVGAAAAASGGAVDAALRDELVSAHSNRRINFVMARRPESTGLAPHSMRLVPLNPSTPSPRVAAQPKDDADTDGAAGPVTPPYQLFDESSLQLSWTSAFQMGAGLRNLGNTCFLNATLQCLTYVPPLANYALANGHAKLQDKKSGFNALVALGDHIQLALRSPGRKLAPQGLVHNLKKIGRIFRVGRQEDAHEFMRYLVEAMQLGCVGAKKLPPGVADTSVVHCLFGGLLCSSLQCDCCQGRPSLTYDPFMDLSLEIVRAGSVEQALARFCEAERLDGDNKYKCERTNRKVAATKRFAIHRAPNVLTLQLKRFESYGARGGKIDRQVKFSPTLDLAPFMSQPSRDKGQHMYSLTGVLVHQGRSTHSGHYYAFVRSPGGGWHRMDDEHVAPVSEAKVCEQQAYMLFYTKVGQGAATVGAPAKAPSAPVGNRLANGQEPPLDRSKAPLSVRTKGEYDLAPAGPEAPSLPPSPTRPPTPRRVGRVRDARIAGMRHLVARTLAKTKAAQRKKMGVQKRSAAKEKPALPPLPVADAAPQHATAAAQSGVWFQRTRADGEVAPAQDLPVARKRVKASAAAVVAEPPRPAHAPASEADDAALRAALSYPRRYNAYGVDGIARWEDVAHTPAAAAADALVRQQRPAFAAKRKDRELYDEEYDKGKVKKVKMRALGGMLEGDNPFDARPAPARQAGGAKRGAGQARRMAGKDKRRGKAR